MRSTYYFAALPIVLTNACQSGALPPATALTKPVEIPFKLQEQLPTISVQIGDKTYPLMFDLGDARGLTLSPKVLKQVQPRFTGKFIQVKDVMGHIVTSRQFVLDRVQLGDRVLTDIVGYEDIYDPSYPSPNPYGSLGRPLFQQDILLIDYPRKRLVVLDPSRWLLDGDSCTAFEAENFGLVSRISTPDGEINALWDTGAQQSVLKGMSNPEPKSHTIKIAEKVYDVTFVKFPFEEPPVDAFLGYSFFAQHVVYIDLKQGCFAINPQMDI